MLIRSLFLLVAFISALMQTSVVYAELKVGVYDNRQILDNMPMVQKEFKKLNAEFEPKQKEISDKQKKLIALKDDVEKNGPILSSGDLQAKQLELLSKRRELQLLVEDTERLANLRRNEVIRNIQGLVDTEVSKFAEEEAYDLIIRSGVLFASAKVDITQQILKRLAEK